MWKPRLLYSVEGGTKSSWLRAIVQRASFLVSCSPEEIHSWLFVLRDKQRILPQRLEIREIWRKPSSPRRISLLKKIFADLVYEFCPFKFKANIKWLTLMRITVSIKPALPVIWYWKLFRGKKEWKNVTDVRYSGDRSQDRVHIQSKAKIQRATKRHSFTAGFKWESVNTCLGDIYFLLLSLFWLCFFTIILTLINLFRQIAKVSSLSQWMIILCSCHV